MKYSKERINIFTETKVIKMENDKQAAADSSEYIRVSLKRNKEVLGRFARRMKLNMDELWDLYYIHRQFKVTRRKIRYAWMVKKEYFEWKCRDIKKKILKYY